MGVRFWHIALWISITAMACSPSSEGERSLPVTPDQPGHFVQLTAVADNPYDPAKAALGKRLFFDPILSLDSSISCSTCHLPRLSLTDGKPVAAGLKGRRGIRNAPALLNLAWITEGLFWDGRSPTLEDQALSPITNPAELGSSWPLVEQRLRAHPSYPVHFKSAFGVQHVEEIDRELVAKALAQFQRTLISSESKYDSVVRGAAAYTPLESRGRAIFFDASEALPDGECGHCHTPPLFTDQSFVNNGVQEQTAPYTYADPGRGGVTGIRYENGQFRVPSLRNVALTAPYMHDGRFATLEEVIEHYNRGGHPGPNVDPKIRKLHLSDEDKAALVAFLGTLTDTSFVRNLPVHKDYLQ